MKKMYKFFPEFESDFANDIYFTAEKPLSEEEIWSKFLDMWGYSYNYETIDDAQEEWSCQEYDVD